MCFREIGTYQVSDKLLDRVLSSSLPPPRTQELLAFKADVNAADAKLETPLSIATRAGMVEAVGVLFAAGATIEICDVDGHLAGDIFSSKARFPVFCGSTRVS